MNWVRRGLLTSLVLGTAQLGVGQQNCANPGIPDPINLWRHQISVIELELIETGGPRGQGAPLVWNEFDAEILMEITVCPPGGEEDLIVWQGEIDTPGQLGPWSTPIGETRFFYLCNSGQIQFSVELFETDPSFLDWLNEILDGLLDLIDLAEEITPKPGGTSVLKATKLFRTVKRLIEQDGTRKVDDANFDLTVLIPGPQPAGPCRRSAYTAIDVPFRTHGPADGFPELEQESRIIPDGDAFFRDEMRPYFARERANASGLRALELERIEREGVDDGHLFGRNAAGIRSRFTRLADLATRLETPAPAENDPNARPGQASLDIARETAHEVCGVLAQVVVEQLLADAEERGVQPAALQSFVDLADQAGVEAMTGQVPNAVRMYGELAGDLAETLYPNFQDSVVVVGTSCGRSTIAGSRGQPTITGDFAFRLTQAEPDSFTIALLGIPATTLLPGGCTAHVGLPAVIALPALVDHAGLTEIPFSPDDPNLAGLTLGCQFVTPNDPESLFLELGFSQGIYATFNNTDIGG